MRTTLLLLDLVILLVLFAAVQQIDEAEHALVSQKVPSLLAAQHIRSSLRAMDGAFAGELLNGAKIRDMAKSATDPYQGHRSELLHNLIDSAEHVSPDQASAQPIEDLETELGNYERLLQRARDLNERDQNAALSTYTAAAEVLDGHLLPAAEALDRAAAAELQQSRDLETLRFRTFVSAAMVGGFVLFVVLGYTQLDLSRRTRRTLNLPLVAGTMLLLTAGVALNTLLERSQKELALASTTQLDELMRDLKLRAAVDTSFDMESRAVLDRAHQSKWIEAFTRQTDEVASLPAALTPEQVENALREGHEVAGFHGLLTELSTAGTSERATAAELLARWQPFVLASRHVLRVDHAEGVGQASSRLLGQGPDDVLATRDRFQQASEGTTEKQSTIVQDGLAASASDAHRALAAALLLSGLFGGLVTLGFAPRLREYGGH